MTLLAKIHSPEALVSLLCNRTGKVVFTNGCFDILHRGHVQFLEEARQLGDCLVVALNTDRSIQQLKGQERPIQPLEDRLRVMAALECVHFVTWFDTETPLELIKMLKPDCLVKGGDWKIEDIVGGPLVHARGGEVHSLPYLNGKSTTELIHKIRSL